MMKRFNNTKGYTIIELLTVIGILVIVSGIISGVLYSTLRGTNKTKITTSVAQNGSYALSIISGVVIASNAITAIGPLTPASDPPFTDCTASPSYQTISFKSENGSTTTFACEGGADGYISSNTGSGAVPLIDTSQVKIDTTDPANCYFTCSQAQNKPYNTPVIDISFILTDKKDAAGVFENKSSGTFKTTVSLRNYVP